MKREIKYSKAYDENNNIINVESLDRNVRKISKEKYHCIACNQPIIPKLGDYRRKHFAHEISNICNKETYLHNLAKKTLFDNLDNRINNDKPFYFKSVQNIICKPCHLTPSQFCRRGTENNEIDILKKYRKVLFETKDGDFTPDISLKNDTDKLWIEIFVTHEVSKEKILSGTKIIEIKVTKEEEIEYLNKEYIDLTNPNNKMYNIKIPPIDKEFNPDDCLRKDIEIERKKSKVIQSQRLYAYIDKEGKVFSRVLDLNQINEIRKSNNCKFIKPLEEGSIFKLIKYIKSAIQFNINPIKSCLICKHAERIFDSSNQIPVNTCLKFQKTKKDIFKNTCDLFQQSSQSKHFLDNEVVCNNCEFNEITLLGNPRLKKIHCEIRRKAIGDFNSITDTASICNDFIKD